jgi:type I restriction enzyme S subunit
MSFGESIADLIDQSLDPILQTAKSWQRVPLAEVVDILNGYPWPSSGFSADQGKPVIRIRNVVDGETSTFYQGEIVDGYWILPGDLLVGMDGDFNRNFWRGQKALLNQRVCKLSVKPGFYDERFLYRVLPGYLGLINKHTSSVTVKHLSSKTLAEIPLPLPPSAEQKRIVTKLDALSAKSARARIELSRIETLVSRYKQSVLSKAFSGELTREWRDLVGGLAPVRPRQAQQMKPAYRFSLEQAFDPPYDLPTSWEWLTFPSIGDLDRGKSKHRPRNDPRLFDGPFPFIQTGEVRAADQYVREHSQTYSEFGLAQSKLWPPETLCITIAANIAETALLSYPACFPDSVVGFSGDADKMLPRYAEFFLRTAKERIAQFAPATAQKNINLEILAAVRLPVAPLQEQHEIVRRIESAFAKIDRLAKEAKRALELVGRLDEAILAKAFRGELVPQDENDEPAEKLLERILTERDTSLKVKSKRLKRVTTMPTASDFLNTKLENWPADGTSFQDLKREFGGNYDDLKEALFASLSDEKSPLQQIFDDKTSMITFRKRER